MKLFQKLLLAPAALGLLAPVAANAADVNIAGLSQYGPSSASGRAAEQVTSITQFSDVQPTDWAYQALSNLIERYGCVAGYPNGTYRGNRAMTRYEAAALLNACLDRITEVTDELKRLMKEFERELAVLRGRVDGLEARVGELEATQFSTTTKLRGQSTFVLGALNFGGTNTTSRDLYNQRQGGTTFNYDVRLNFDTSFTGTDLLRTTLRTGNFSSSGFGNGRYPWQLEAAFQECTIGYDCENTLNVNRLFYRFNASKDIVLGVGGLIRQDDLLAMWPSVYPADSILDFFTRAGAPGAYSLNLGSGAGGWLKKGDWSLSASYIAATGNAGNPSGWGRDKGGIGTRYSNATGSVQLGYQKEQWGAAALYNYTTPFDYSQVYGGGATRAAAFVPAIADSTNSFALSAYWQPSNAGLVPSISAGWGWNSSNGFSASTLPNVSYLKPVFSNWKGNITSQSWSVGLQWDDVLVKGNELGMGVGQMTFITSGIDLPATDGNYAWEWWYKLQMTDNISVTPALFYQSRPYGAVSGRRSDNPTSTFSALGGLIKTTFKF
ncbi:iron uptake porin [Synechococcus sp. W4D4]|uniref:iron uptake porin n=1 Tax=Synechococcus sp. W4D4 TaxID=3392294 RepID=UPI0039E90183